jgi:LysM repeat protein
MKRIIRLTETDLARIVRRVINEQGISGAAKAAVDVVQKGLGYQDDLIDTRKTNGGDVWSKTKPNMTSYKVKQGDTLSSIASKYGLTLDQLIKLNPGLDDPNKIFTGQMIKLK